MFYNITVIHPNDHPIIQLSGLPGSGKSTQAKLLAEVMPDLGVISISDVIKELASKKGETLQNRDDYRKYFELNYEEIVNEVLQFAENRTVPLCVENQRLPDLAQELKIIGGMAVSPLIWLDGPSLAERWKRCASRDRELDTDTTMEQFKENERLETFTFGNGPNQLAIWSMKDLRVPNMPLEQVHGVIMEYLETLR